MLLDMHNGELFLSFNIVNWGYGHVLANIRNPRHAWMPTLGDLSAELAQA